MHSIGTAPHLAALGFHGLAHPLDSPRLLVSALWSLLNFFGSLSMRKAENNKVRLVGSNCKIEGCDKGEQCTHELAESDEDEDEQVS